ncbi:hypothetical protein ACK3ZP_20940 [Aeromonas caviae]
MKANPICADGQHINKTPGEDRFHRRGTLLPSRCAPAARYFNPIEVTTDA